MSSGVSCHPNLNSVMRGGSGAREQPLRELGRVGQMGKPEWTAIWADTPLQFPNWRWATAPFVCNSTLALSPASKAIASLPPAVGRGSDRLFVFCCCFLVSFVLLLLK